jgi:hypothetical protein
MHDLSCRRLQVDEIWSFVAKKQRHLTVTDDPQRVGRYVDVRRSGRGYEARSVLPDLKAAVALHFAWYNFCRQHKTLRVSPAMAAGVEPRLWSLGDLVAETVH